MVNRAPVDPEIQAILDALPIKLGAFQSADELVAQRASRAPLYQSLAVASGADHVVDAGAGIIARVITRGRSSRPRPCLFWLHGGGYMSGNRLLDDKLLDRWCVMFDCLAVSVEYRLAPEHPFPTPIEDCYAAFQWLLNHADDLGVDTKRIAVGGISAGGGLAAAMALLARDRKAPALAAQILISPMIDDRQGQPSNAWDVPVWPPTANRIGWEAYLAGAAAPNAYAAPARAEDLSGLPRAYVVVGSAEVFLDESIAYARRLIDAGNMAELHVIGGAPHGFETLARECASVKRAFGLLDAWLADALGAPIEALGEGA